MRIIAETNDLEPPYPSTNATFRLQLNEDQVLPLGAAELEYFDDFSGPEDVTFEIIKSCHCVKCNRHLKDPNDLGRIVDLSNSLDWEKNENYQPVTSFTQRQLNHLRLGYQPPRMVFKLIQESRCGYLILIGWGPQDGGAIEATSIWNRI